MRKIGYHTSVSKGFVAAMGEVSAYGANTFQFFTRNPRGSRAKALDEEDLEAFCAARESFGPLFAHGAYTMNLASSKENVREKSVALIRDDMARLARYPEDTIYVFHPGAHTGDGIATGIDRIISGLDRVKEDFPDRAICLETMSGKGSEVGSRLEELSAIIDALGDEKLGVVLDTCHLFSAGYDLTRPDDVASAIEETVGLKRVRGIHVNDSLTPFAAKKDRHAPLGAGEIGLLTIGDFVGYRAFRGLPLALETPGEGDDHKKEIAALYAHLQSM
ncbi:MAG: deoxyribonuclease IV [Peptoniphilus sp.]|nr:deoxyribonuclease IV [Peptoniphilus sp.]MDD7363486.1 deoxyribonuclease IV [Bacillota bacterium]MDY6044810.1 deoxyribonuclease IV [Peptoniphilus sp.]